MLNEAHVARPKAPDSDQPNMFWHHTPSKHRAGPRLAKHHQQRHTLNEVHAARPKAPDSTPPCMFHHRTSHQPSSSQPKLEGNIATFHSQQGPCRTPKGAPDTASLRKFRHRTAAVNRPRPPTTTPTPQAYAHVRRIVLGAWGWRKI